MHLTALVDRADHVCCRYRIAAFRPALERAGHTLEMHPLPAGWWGRMRLFRNLRGANVILQRRLLPGWQLYLLRRAVRTLIFDFDDAVFLRDSYSPKGMHDTGRLRRFAATVQACDAVSAGNAFLAAEARRHAIAARIEVIPTCVDAAKYPLAAHASNRDVKLVWVGSSSTLQGLRAVSPLLEAIGRGVPGTKLKMICDSFFELHGLPVVTCPWSEATEATEIAAADMGIAHMPDDQWSRGKCGLKVLQYMAAGLPVVANSVGVHTEMVRHGETGFLADTPAQWVEAIARLAADPELRRRLGRMGRAIFEARYGLGAGAMGWLNLIHELEPARHSAFPFSRPSPTGAGPAPVRNGRLNEKAG